MTLLTRAARSCVVLTTSLSVACSGGWCGSARSSIASQSTPAGAPAAGRNAVPAGVSAERERVPLDTKLDVPIVPPDAPSPEALAAAIDALEPSASRERYDLAAQARVLGSSV